jgi:hypothetical protein
MIQPAHHSYIEIITDLTEIFQRKPWVLINKPTVLICDKINIRNYKIKETHSWCNKPLILEEIWFKNSSKKPTVLKYKNSNTLILEEIWFIYDVINALDAPTWFE